MPFFISAAARNALKRKKQHEHSLEQTSGQISMLEQQIYSIESANINQETLVAMKNAGKAMKEIHGKMTMEDVDVTMCVTPPLPSPTYPSFPFTSLYVPLEDQPQLIPILLALQGTTPRTTRTHPRNRQRHHLHAYHRAHRRRRTRSRSRGARAGELGREDVEDGDGAGGRFAD